MSVRRYLAILVAGGAVIVVYALVAILVLNPVAHLPAEHAYGYGAIGPWVLLTVAQAVFVWAMASAAGTAAGMLAAVRTPVPWWRVCGGLAVAWGWLAATTLVPSFIVGLQLYIALEQIDAAPPTGETGPWLTVLWPVGTALAGAGLLLLVADWAAQRLRRGHAAAPAFRDQS